MEIPESSSFVERLPVNKAADPANWKGWKKGPLPPNTYFWGGVVPFDHKGTGFFFADFRGDHVELVSGRVLQAHEVAAYNNCLELPPKELF